MIAYTSLNNNMMLYRYTPGQLPSDVARVHREDPMPPPPPRVTGRRRRQAAPPTVQPPAQPEEEEEPERPEVEPQVNEDQPQRPRPLVVENEEEDEDIVVPYLFPPIVTTDAINTRQDGNKVQRKATYSFQLPDYYDDETDEDYEDIIHDAYAIFHRENTRHYFGATVTVVTFTTTSDIARPLTCTIKFKSPIRIRTTAMIPAVVAVVLEHMYSTGEMDGGPLNWNVPGMSTRFLQMLVRTEGLVSLNWSSISNEDLHTSWKDLMRDMDNRFNRRSRVRRIMETLIEFTQSLEARWLEEGVKESDSTWTLITEHQHVTGAVTTGAVTGLAFHSIAARDRAPPPQPHPRQHTLPLLMQDVPPSPQLSSDEESDIMGIDTS